MAKRLEDEKALVKVTGARPGGNQPKKRLQDPNDLRHFLEKGAPAKYDGRKSQRHQPYTQQRFSPKTAKGKGKKLWK